jgi:predicted nucleic acid-binding protein
VTAARTPRRRGAPRAVLDTSVLLSEHRHWLWLLARLGYYRGVWSTFIVGELVRVRVEHSIARSVARPIYRQRINDLVHLFSDVLTAADYRLASAAGLLRDPDDEPILATAIVARAAFVVSLNTRDFPSSGTIVGVHFVTPQSFLAELETRRPRARLAQQVSEAGRQVP